MNHAWHLSTPMVLASLALDVMLGDPRWVPHPVVAIGRAISWGERRFHTGERMHDLRAGAGLAVAIIALSGCTAWLIIALCDRAAPAIGALGAVLLGWTALALRGLDQAAAAVEQGLRARDDAAARRAIPALVGRDPGALDHNGLLRATLESIAENSSDGVVAPLFYLFLAGPVGAIAYKAINTLDSMIGYRDQRYLYFGRAAARIDDLANFIPARLTALCIVGAAAILTGRWSDALRTCLADGSKHSSPNAAYPEAAMAGAIGVELGGDAVYQNEVEHRAVLGRCEHQPYTDDLTVARKILWVTAGLAFLMLAAARYTVFSS